MKNSKVGIICNVILLFIFLKLEDTSTKGVIKREIEKGQIMAKIKKTNNYLQNTTKKTTLKQGVEFRCLGRKASSICSDFDTLSSSSCINILSTTYQEKFEDTKGVIRIPKSKNRQHNGQKKKYKRTNSDLQNIHIKLKIEYQLKVFWKGKQFLVH